MKIILGYILNLLNIKYNIIDNIFIIKNINYYFLLSFILISLNSRHLRGTTYRNNVMPNKYILYISKFTFIMFLYSSFYLINTFINYNKIINILFLFYIPYYIEFSEYTGERKLSMNHFIYKFYIKLFKLLGNYSIKNSDKIIDNNDEQYLIGIHPHGLFPFGTIGCYGLPICNNINETIPLLYNTSDYFVGIASFCFYIPILRDFFLSLGAIDCSKPIIEEFINRKKTMFLFIGGAEEAKFSDYGNTTLIINKRKGFFKLAFKYGLTIIPCYTFGNNNTYKSYNFDLFNLFYYFKKITGIWFPRGKILFNKINFITITGKHIKIEKKENVTDEDLYKIQEIYKRNLIELFNSNKYLDQSTKDKELVII